MHLLQHDVGMAHAVTEKVIGASLAERRGPVIFCA